MFKVYKWGDGIENHYGPLRILSTYTFIYISLAYQVR